MKKFWRQYLNSFQLKRTFVYTLLVDVLAVVIIAGLFKAFYWLVEIKGDVIAKGIDPEQFQQMIVSSTADQLQALSGSMQSFVLIFLIGTIVILLISLFIYSLSKSLIWNKITNRKLSNKNYWKWNGLNVLLIFPLIIYFFGFVIIRLALMGLLEWITTNLYVLEPANLIINLIGLFFFLNYLFLVYWHFVKSYKVWESVGAGLRIIKEKFRDFYKVFLLQVGTITLIGVIFVLFKDFFRTYEGLGLVINIVVTLILLAWMRLYLVNVLFGDGKIH